MDTRISSDIRAEPPTLCWASVKISRSLNHQLRHYSCFFKLVWWTHSSPEISCISDGLVTDNTELKLTLPSIFSPKPCHYRHIYKLAVKYDEIRKYFYVYFFILGWCRNRNDKILPNTKDLNQYSMRYYILVETYLMKCKHLGNYRKLLLN